MKRRLVPVCGGGIRKEGMSARVVGRGLRKNQWVEVDIDLRKR